MEKILISACLVGDNTKYDGGNNLREKLEGLLEFFDLVPFCPEVEGGLPTPRDPSEQRGSNVISSKGKDVTCEFQTGADKALRLCRLLGIRKAILKERSPSCGVHTIASGYFVGRMVDGQGVTARLLKENGIEIMNEEEAEALLESLIAERERKEISHQKFVARQEKEAEEKRSEEKPRFRKKFGEEKRFDADKPHRYGEKKEYGKKPFGKFKKEGGYHKDGEKRFGKGAEKGKRAFGDRKFSKKPYSKEAKHSK